MDQKTLREIAGQKIDKYATTLPSRLKDDFVQDMWVFALNGLLPTFAGSTARLCDIRGDIDLAIFRRQESWVRKNKRQVVCEQPEDASPEPSASDTPVSLIEARETVEETAKKARETVEELARSLARARYTPEHVQTVILGFQQGLTQKEIAQRVGRSPQLFCLHLKSFRTAA